MYRIMIARNGYYYVQHHNGYFWRKVGGFFHTKAGARALIRDDKMYRRLSPDLPFSRVVEYR
jgi:hypothetical protein